MTPQAIGMTVLQNFSPTRSPFYPITAFSVTALLLSCSGIRDDLWYYVSVPIYGSLLLAIVFCFYSRPTLSAEEHHEQLLFARSLNISVAVLGFSLTAAATDEIPWAFKATFVVCIGHTFVFFLYTLARSRSKQPLELNFVQLALVTMSLVIGICYALHSFAATAPQDNLLDSHYFIVFLALLLPWLACIGFWAAYALKTIIRIPSDTAPIAPSASAQDSAAT